MTTLVNTIDEEFDLICAHFSNKTAVSDSSTQLTYYDLYYISQQCEQAIRHYIPEEDSPVIVSLANQLSLYGLFIGIMKVGRPYFYIEPNEHPAIKLQLAKKVGAGLVIGEKVHDYGVPHLGLEKILNQVLDSNRIIRSKKNHSIACCLIQTSASIQDARLVAIQHSALRHHIKQFQNTLSITAHDRIGLLSLPKFSASTAAIYGSLLLGASFFPFSFKSEGLNALIEWIQRKQITVLHTTPSLFRLIAHYASKEALSQIRAIKLGGETLYSSDFYLFKEKFSKQCLFINGLGMSEVGGNVTHYVLTPHSTLVGDLDIIPVGKVLPGHQIRIVDEQKKNLPVGELGEIVISSTFIAAGYWNAHSGENCHFNSMHCSQKREFYTNDLGYFLPDGNLIHIGRKNRVFKRLGLRVDLNQIESVLLGFSNIQNASAYVVPIEGKNEVYSVSIQFLDKKNDELEPIILALRSIIPEHMLPQCIHLVDDFPMTSSGKIDRKALIQERLNEHQFRTIIAPRNKIEKYLVEMWKELFSIEAISIYDNFFALGGNSLKSIEFCSRLKNDLHIDYRPEYLVEKSFIAQIAEDIFFQKEEQTLAERHITPFKVSIVSLRKASSSDQIPLVILSGGIMSEKEIVLTAQLLPYLSSRYVVYALRLNVHHADCDLPSSIEDLSSLLVQQILELNLTCPPILIGECVSCVSATHVAKKLSERLKFFVDVLLLNPWHPRGIMTSHASHSIRSTDYFLNLLKQAKPQCSQGNVTLFLPQNQILTQEDYIKWWTEMHGVKFQLKSVPGNSFSYIRRYRSDLASCINLLFTSSLMDLTS